MDVKGYEKIPLRTAVIIPQGWSESHVGRLAEQTFRLNLPLFLTQVEFVRETLSSGSGYDLIIRPEITKVPQMGDSPLEFEFRVAFLSPSGVRVFEVPTRGITEIMREDIKRLMAGKDPRSSDNVYQWALGQSQAAAISGLFTHPEVIRGLRAYTQWAQEQTRLEAERRALPSDLITSVHFDDTRGLLTNGLLDAGEEAELVLTVRNQGRGSGYGVVLAVSADQPQMNLPGPQELGEIPPGQSREIRLPVKARLDLPDGEASLLVEARERRGYDARRVKLVLPTVRLERPSLSIAAYEINDGSTGRARGNGNGIPENGETVELLAFVRNAGPGAAAGVALSVATGDPGVEVVQKDTSLGVILPNQTARGTLVLAISRAHVGGTLNLGLRVSDGRGETVASAARQVALAVTSRAPVLAAVTRILGQGREVKELTNDQTVDLEVIPRNTGTLDAEQVVVRVSADQPGVAFRRDRVEVGSLKAGAEGLPQRFELTVPRAFGHDRLPLTVELSQRDFPGRAERLNLPVKVRRPVLVSSFSIIGRHGGRAIEQNETADLEVRILNTGDLPGRDVETRIDVTAPGVEVQGPKSVALGTIPPNDQSVARFRLRLLRSVPPGELPIALAIAQADFPSLSDTLRVEVRPEQAEEKRVAATPPAPPPPSRSQRPIIAPVNPSDGQFVHGERVELRATVVDEKKIDRIHVVVNGRPVPEEAVRQGLRRRPVEPGSTRDRADLTVPVPLDRGRNTLTLTAYNAENERDQVSLTVTRLEDRPHTGGVPPTLVPYADVDRYVLALGAGQQDRRRWAVIVGIEQYRKAPAVAFASRDAYAMKEYVVKLLGVPSEQVFLLVDDQATKGEVQVVLEDRLQQRVQPGDTVYVYFAGHGISEVKDGAPYLLPADGDPQSLRVSAYPANEFYAALGKLKADRVLVFLDACFSGLSARQEQPQMLLAGARPGVLVVKDPVLASPNLTSFAAAQNDQVSNAYKEQAHGLFTYFLLKGLGGAADKNGDGVLRLSELAEYVKDQVSRTSRHLFGQTLHQSPVVKPDVELRRDMSLREK